MTRRGRGARRTRPSRRAATGRAARVLKRSRRTQTKRARRNIVSAVGAREIDVLRRELQRAAARSAAPRWNANPDDVQRSVIQLVLTLVEFIRRLLERQAIRRLEAGALTRKQTEDVGTALMRLEETIHDLAEQFNLAPEDLNLDLGPVGKLM